MYNSASSMRGPWSPGEDSCLLTLIEEHGPSNWVRISSILGSRTPKQCRERYHQNLKPSLNRTPITDEEGQLIEQLVLQHGKKWAEIARHLNGRSDNAVKNWWNGGANRRRRASLAMQQQHHKHQIEQQFKQEELNQMYQHQSQQHQQSQQSQQHQQLPQHQQIKQHQQNHVNGTTFGLNNNNNNNEHYFQPPSIAQAFQNQQQRRPHCMSLPNIHDFPTTNTVTTAPPSNNPVVFNAAYTQGNFPSLKPGLNPSYSVDPHNPLLAAPPAQTLLSTPPTSAGIQGHRHSFSLSSATPPSTSRRRGFGFEDFSFQGPNSNNNNNNINNNINSPKSPAPYSRRVSAVSGSQTSGIDSRTSSISGFSSASDTDDPLGSVGGGGISGLGGLGKYSLSSSSAVSASNSRRNSYVVLENGGGSSRNSSISGPVTNSNGNGNPPGTGVVNGAVNCLTTNGGNTFGSHFDTNNGHQIGPTSNYHGYSYGTGRGLARYSISESGQQGPQGLQGLQGLQGPQGHQTPFIGSNAPAALISTAPNLLSTNSSMTPTPAATPVQATGPTTTTGTSTATTISSSSSSSSSAISKDASTTKPEYKLKISNLLS